MASFTETYLRETTAIVEALDRGAVDPIAAGLASYAAAADGCSSSG